ncbi:hypothetical protein MOMA_04580 [Moraxella macacae 0408225]|uniref:UPF0756 membrane protein MOMA_04580 n=1 Tax=Moraxella macacae 0408225 TaxID=1230338 RepID=L2F9E6_9GAMM|nr:DUF441 domain-containing protein [Moraxella macacae]ELA09652.1 hypothetical protein MOMA_04580 [Moraxella macacae 0408225]
MLTGLNINPSLMMLLILLSCGIISQNNTIIIATAVLIILSVLPMSKPLLLNLEKYGLNFGILILTIGVLAPIATGKISSDGLLKSFANWRLLLAVLVGVFVAWLGGRGVKLMSADPGVVAGLLIGTVLGVTFLRGVPVGPLIAAGILSLLYSGYK